MKKLLMWIAPVILALGIMIPSPALANTGTWNFTEFNEVCSIIFCSGSATSQSGAQDICQCTGTLINTWTDNGYSFKDVQYADTYESGGVDWEYRLGSGGVWRAYSGRYCKADGCYLN